MNQVLAKVKGSKNRKVFKLISDQTLFENLVISDDACVKYNPDHNLDPDSWFKVENFKTQEYCIDLLRNFDSKNLDDLPKEKFGSIEYLCSVQKEDYYFQKITPSLFVSKKMIAFGEHARVEKSGTKLVVNTLPHAVYLKSEDTLIFRSLSSITNIFKGIDELYKEATKKEVKNFLDHSFIDLSNGYGINNISKPNRKRIALAKVTLDAMSTHNKTQMLTYIQDYCGKKLKFDKNIKKFEITTDNQLKLLLYGIEQRFYTTQFSQEKRLANSVQPLS